MKKSLFIFVLALAATHLMAAKVYFINPYGWSTVKAYLWTDGGEMAWPGQDMTKESGMSCTKGDVYSIEADSYEFIIFNNGSEQTDDLTIDPARPYWYMEIAYASIEEIESSSRIGEQFVDEASGLKFEVTSVNPNSVQVINNGYTGNSYIIPTDVLYSGNIFSVTTIGNEAFLSCDGLTSITIPNSVTTIGSYAFAYCSDLTSVTIGNSVTTIGVAAFNYCTGLTKTNYTGTIADWCKIKFGVSLVGDVTNPMSYSHNFYINDVEIKDLVIPEGVESIGGSAFYGCSGLTSVTIPNSVTTIGGGAFALCEGVTKTNYTGTIDDWCKIKFGSSAANPTCYSYNLFINDVEIKDLVIPEGIDTIGNYAFYNCKGLTSVIIPNSVTTIGNYAFYDCSGLTSVTIPNSVTTIGESAFSFCYGLTSVTIPNSVTTIGKEAFYICYSLKSITCYATNPPTCGQDCFDKTITVYVPLHTIGAYKQTKIWKDYGCYSIEEVFVSVNNDTYGSVHGGGHQQSENVTLTAVPTDGHHFVQWSDGNTENPRSFVLTHDTAFIAEFANNIYSFDVQTADSIMGSVVGKKGNYEYGTSLDVSAQPNYGYHFTQWSDGNKQNPRTFTLTKDTELTAYFAKNIYSVSASKSQYGSIFGTGKYNYLDTCTLTITPDFGYNFIGWNDGNTDNPRSLVVTQDTTFTAQFEQQSTIMGRCGDDLAWNLHNGVLTITGSGDMYDSNYDSWSRWADQITTINLPKGLTHIGQYAFANCVNVTRIDLPASVTSIGCGAFYNDYSIEEITCPTSAVPTVDCDETFYRVSQYVYVYVISDLVRKYQINQYWQKFDIQVIGAEEKPVTGDEVTVNPSADNATFTWPQNDQAAGYSIEITKDGIVFCTLTFNAQGQLTGIAFAPNRAGSRMLDAAVMTANGWQFTVTGLDQASKYGYALDALNASKQSIKHYEGEFATDGYTSLEWVISDKIQGINKMLLDGHLYILRDGNLYNATGARVK